MTEKELRRLKRGEVLQLLLVQVKEAEELRRQLEETKLRLQEEETLTGRLKARLNHKDAQLHRLKDRLNKKDEQIRGLRETVEKQKSRCRMETAQTGSIAEASLRLSGVFEAAQKAADLYLENVRRLCKEQSETEE